MIGFPWRQPAPPEPNEEGEWELQVGEPLVGHRIWRVERRHGLLVLTGVFHRVHWPHRKQMRARCLTKRMPQVAGPFANAGAHGKPSRVNTDHTNHVAPGPKPHECGIYAVSHEKPENAWGATANVGNVGNLYADICTGTVKLWGRIVLHEKGWRAQYAYPHRLTLQPCEANLEHAPLMALELADRYGVKVNVGPTREALLRPAQ